MQYIQGHNRHQSYFSTLEDQVAVDNTVRLIDAFIDKLDLQQLGFSKMAQKTEGRPAYAPQVLLKLYLYGYLNKMFYTKIIFPKKLLNLFGFLHSSCRWQYISISQYQVIFD
jgi:hypothetical protein